MNTPQYDKILSIASIFILLVFIGIALYYAMSDTFNYIPTTDSTGTTRVMSPCPTGECATNIFNGSKRCPTTDQDVIDYDIASEVCNPRDRCTNRLTPYSINSDGSTSYTGICESNPVLTPSPSGVGSIVTLVPSTCRCSSIVTCADYITAVFKTVDGNPYVSTTGQRTQFKQQSIAPSSRIDSDASKTFCEIPSAWLNRTSPGCTSGTSISDCMTSGQSLCISGTMAFITDDSSIFSTSSITTTPLGCVTGNPCPFGQVTLWDTQYDGIVCKSI